MAPKNLSNNQRNAIYDHLLEKTVNGKLPRGSMTSASTIFNVSRSTIYRIWKRGKSSRVSSTSNANVDSRIKANSGRRVKRTPSGLKNTIRELPLNKRRTIRLMAEASGIPRSTLHRAKKSGWIRRHTNSIKPKLTTENKIRRMRFAISFISRCRGDKYEFNNMYDVVHIDEKWFNMYKGNENFYIVPGEEEPERSTQSKKYIGKIMFLCAVARPRYDYHKKNFFDGKIGIWPFVVEEAAKRTSKNRVKGTLEMKPINVTKEVYSEYLENKVFPAIREKMPSIARRKIKVQQDNAPPHISNNDSYDLQNNVPDNVKLELISQPPNSPDMNVLDLGLFNALQSVQLRTPSNNIKHLVDSVTNAYAAYPSSKISDIFITLQSVLESTITSNGSNNFKIKHGLKKGLSHEEKLHYNLSCDSAIYTNATKYLQDYDDEN